MSKLEDVVAAGKRKRSEAEAVASKRAQAQAEADQRELERRRADELRSYTVLLSLSPAINLVWAFKSPPSH